MNEYFLFIDTETSGLPKRWDLPYASPGNWPYAVQVSWLVFDKNGNQIKSQNHFISDNDFVISPSAFRIHGLNSTFLQQHGILRAQLLTMLSHDLEEYRPMVVGHFMEFDFHVLAADYYRAGMKNPMEELPTFCTMKGSRHLQQNAVQKFFRLGELYTFIFHRSLLSQHNALVDATATADCFFELVKRKEIVSFDQPPIRIQEKTLLSNSQAWVIVFLLILFFAIIIAFIYG